MHFDQVEEVGVDGEVDAGDALLHYMEVGQDVERVLGIGNFVAPAPSHPPSIPFDPLPPHSRSFQRKPASSDPMHLHPNGRNLL